MYNWERDRAIEWARDSPASKAALKSTKIECIKTSPFPLAHSIQMKTIGLEFFKLILN